MAKYVLYDPDSDALVTTTVFESYEEALEALDVRLDDVIVVPLGVQEKTTDDAGAVGPDQGGDGPPSHS